MYRLPLRFFVALFTFAAGVASVALTATPPRPGATPRPAAAAPARPDDDADRLCLDGAEDVAVEFHYYNHEYGFTVDLPRGVVGARSPSPMPQHGFGVDLDNPHSAAWSEVRGFPKSYLYVDGSGNSALSESLDEAAERQLGYIREDGRDVRLLSRSETRLAGLPAVRFVVSYVDDGEPTVDDVVLALRDGRGAGVVYTIGLSTPQSKYERDRKTVDFLRSTWRLQPLP